ncbi:MAG: 4-hydroxy-tetrahydrodipicolinate reductase [Rikenellaceae bacterium]|nr:4-hydroxy-tetrahydrodipicolinate reductase [Rikenellaceae bacterium]
MKTAIIGYGKMGREIEQILKERGHKVALIIDIDNTHELDADHLKGIDVALEFTTPSTAYENLRTCIANRVPVVSGTTGWTERLEELKSYCLEQHSALFYASNYCLGVNLLFMLNRQLAAQIERLNARYNVEIEEVHHTQKKDSPSGTAITLAEGILENLSAKKQWVNFAPIFDVAAVGTKQPVTEQDLVIRSVREGMVPGIHTVTYTSEDDELVLKHTIKNRRTLAMGAVIAAEFLAGKEGVYSMEDLMA